MDDVTLSFSFRNLVTVSLMGLIGFTAITVVSQLVKKSMKGSDQ